MQKLAFIGAGVMGSSMIKHLLNNGFAVNLYNRTKAKAQALESFGAVVKDSVKEAVQCCDIVITMVGFPQDVEQIYLGSEGILENINKGGIAIDMTTSSPDLARKLYAKGQELGVEVCDAPCTGGDIGAKNASLTVLFGGSKEAYSRARDILHCFSKSIVCFGECGCGQLAKACNQIAVASTMLSTCEAIVFAQKNNIDANLIVNTLSTGAAASFSLQSYGPRILKQDFNPGFFIKHIVKDMKIAIDVAHDLNLHLDGLETAYKLYKFLNEHDLGHLGTQALYKYYTEF